MALTIETVDPFSAEDVFGRQRVRIKDVTLDASYPTGGEALAPADFALSEITGVQVIGNTSGYLVGYNASTGKLVVRGQEPTDAVAGVQALDEVANATDLSAVTVRLLVIGH